MEPSGLSVIGVYSATQWQEGGREIICGRQLGCDAEATAVPQRAMHVALPRGSSGRPNAREPPCAKLSWLCPVSVLSHRPNHCCPPQLRAYRSKASTACAKPLHNCLPRRNPTLVQKRPRQTRPSPRDPGRRWRAATHWGPRTYVLLLPSTTNRSRYARSWGDTPRCES